MRVIVRMAGVGFVVVLLAACQSVAPPTSSPAASTAVAPTASANPQAWARIEPAAIEQPFGFEVVHTGANGQPQTMCAPCHPAVDTTMTGLTAGPTGLVAVGWIFQGFHGDAWHSIDGRTWTLDGQLAEKTIFSAIAADERRYVAVGLDGQGATAWSSEDGLDPWAKADRGPFSAVPLRLSAVTHWAGGFEVAGYEGTEFGSATAAFWRSPDGITWRRAPASPDFEDARPTSIAAGGPGLVAVGTTGPASTPGPAIVWTSPDGLRWSRAPAGPVFEGARMRTVANVPGIGLVAAGEDLAGDTGAVWTSTDGRTWAKAPTSPDLGRPGIQVRMNAAIAGGPGVVIVGTATEGTQYGEGVVWTSPDGLAWTRAPRTVELTDAELTAVTAWGGGIVAVGDRGAPDAYVATVWTSPPAWAH